MWPGSHEEVRAVLEACAAAGVAVVPFGGGTSVVGGVDPVRAAFPAAVTLDLGRLDRLVALDERSLTAVLGARDAAPRGRGAPRARAGSRSGTSPRATSTRRWAAASRRGRPARPRPATGGSTSSCSGLRLAAPAGDLDVQPLPASAAGPALRELVVGSEGALGVITQAALRVHPRPETRRYEGWFFRSFREGAEALRALVQEEAAPDVARLSDEDETRLALALAGGSAAQRALGLYLRARRYAGGCLAIFGWEGERDRVLRRRARSVALLRRHGALELGQRPGHAWEAGRYAAPYLRDDMLAHGVMVETLETAAQWSQLDGLYRAVRDALRDALAGRGARPLVLCHISHLYPTGASLYFTFFARQEAGAELDQWRAAKRAATDAIVAAGGTITHHHAVGRDHADWLPAEVGPLGIALLRAAKAELDPAGILNPGKLLAVRPGG